MAKHVHTVLTGSDKDVMLNFVKHDFPVIMLLGYLCGALKQSPDLTEHRLGEQIDLIAKGVFDDYAKEMANMKKGLN
jgi:hypothetical protein